MMLTFILSGMPIPIAIPILTHHHERSGSSGSSNENVGLGRLDPGLTFPYEDKLLMLQKQSSPKLTAHFSNGVNNGHNHSHSLSLTSGDSDFSGPFELEVNLRYK